METSLESMFWEIWDHIKDSLDKADNENIRTNFPSPHSSLFLLLPMYLLPTLRGAANDHLRFRLVDKSILWLSKVLDLQLLAVHHLRRLTCLQTCLELQDVMKSCGI